MRPSEPRRRNRPALSCIQCRTRKIRCDRNEPCASCMKSKIVNCTYEEARRPKPRLWRLSPAPAGGTTRHYERSPTADERSALGPGYTFRELPVPPVVPSQIAPCPAPGAAPPGRSPEPLPVPGPMPHVDPGPGSTAALADRIRQLEEQLSDALKRPDHVAPLGQLAHTASISDRGASSNPFGTSSLLDGDKLVGCPLYTGRLSP